MSKIALYFQPVDGISAFGDGVTVCGLNADVAKNTLDWFCIFVDIFGNMCKKKRNKINL